jgi:Nif-specific regulatory protein
MLERFAGRYVLLRVIGQGGMGEVFLARDLTTGAECALKRLPRQGPKASNDTLRREFEALTRVRHPVLMRVHELGFAPDSSPYLTMEFVPGLPADRVVRHDDWPAMAFVGARITEGLEALHAAGVAHGDLKPANVLVVAGASDPLPRDVRVLDFGLSALMERDEQGFRGTPGFAAPEVVDGLPPTPASDLYGLGATLYALIAGRRPFEAESDSRSPLERQREGPPSAHPLELAGAPWPLIELILRLMAPRPADRPGSAREARRELESLSSSARRPLAERARAEVVVGRQRELARVDSWIESALTQPRMLVVRGEAGIGKTALLSEVATRVTLGRRAVASWSCEEFHEPGGAARAVSRVLATRATPAGGEPPACFWPEPGVVVDVAALEAWVQAAASHAAEAAGAGPLLVTLDDAEALDPLSLSWMRRLVLREAPVAVLWLLARSDGPDAEDELRVLEETGHAARLALSSLEREEAARIASTRLGGEVPEALEERLWQCAGGHPGRVVELLHAAAADGTIAEHEHGLVVTREDALDALTSSFPFERAPLERIDALGSGARDAARALAVHDAPLDEEDVRRLAPAAGPGALRDLSAAHFARRLEDGRWVLHPPRLASALRDAIPADDRRRMHAAARDLPGLSAAQRFRHLAACGQAGEALDAAAGAFAEHPDIRLALEAASVAESTLPERAGDWLVRAAECHRSRGRYAPMIPLLERALELGPGSDQRSECWLLLSTATLRANEPGRVESVMERALSEGVTPAVRGRLRNNLANAHMARGQMDRAEHEGRQALAESEAAHDDAGIGLACETLVVIENARGHAEAGARWLDRASESHARAQFVPGMVRALTLRASTARMQGRRDEAEALCREAMALAREHGNRLLYAEPLVMLTTVYSEAGRWRDLQAVCVEATRLALEDARPAEAALAFSARATVEGLVGLPRSARRHARTAIRLCARYQPMSRPYAWRGMAVAERIRGRLRAAERAARRALSLSQESYLDDVQWSRLEFGRIAAARERWDEAARVWESAMSRDPQMRSAATAFAVVSLGRASVRRGDRAGAEGRLTQVDQSEVHRSHPLLGAFTRALKAELAFAAGRLSEAVTLGREALDLFEGLPAPADRAQVAMDLARIAPPDDEIRTTVTGWLDDAARTFERLGDRRSRAKALSLAVDWLKRATPMPAQTPRLAGLLERVGWLISSVNDLELLMNRSMRAVVEQLGAERGVLLLADPETGQLAPVAEYGAIEPSTRHAAVGFSRRVVERVAEVGSSLLVRDAPTDPRAASKSVVDMRVQSILCVPLFVGGRTVGAVYLDDTRRTHAFDVAERSMIEGFAHLMAVAIERSRRYEEVRREYEKLEGENLSLRKAVGTRLKHHGMIGSSAPMERVMAMVERAAAVNTTVLITGENGTGKELIARTLHHNGKRALKPFVEVNCGAIPPNLVESTLFGILPNVATGVRAQPGKFQLAHGGTLFLDEIAEMPETQQVALLMVLANREVTPVGGIKPIAVDVRIIAATNRDVQSLVEQRKFREDLYYRLSVIEIEVPPLRERKQDIPDLAKHFLQHYAKQQEREVPHLSPDFLTTLMRSDWPGNVRELRNYIERMLAMSPGNYLRPDPPPRDLERHVLDGRLLGSRKLTDAVSEVEQRALITALERAGGNQSEAGRQLGLTEQSVRYRIRKYGLVAPRDNRRSRR